MSIKDFKDVLIPEIKRHVNVPVIEADQIGDPPDGPHVVFKITMRYGKDRGQADERGITLPDSLVLSRVESFKRVISFTAYDMDNDSSIDLAQKVHDWFSFVGYDFLSSKNMVLVEATSVQNRDSFVLEDYERQNGFDVTLRLTRELQQVVEYIEQVNVT